jgi:pimeloyl-ACP methyl ester carboxylesterase
MSTTKNIFAPKWFTTAVQTAVEERVIQVRGASIHYLTWGKVGKPGLLFIHGGFAHAHWWDFIAPFFTRDYCVAAIDLGGMGDSSHRERYSAKTFAEEVMSVCVDAGFDQRAIIVGHSFGGLVALKTAILHGKKLSGVVLVDFPLRPPELQNKSSRPWIKPKETYPNREAALKRFRLIPPQPCKNEFILKYIAGHSLARTNGGWSWKFDDKIFDNFKAGDIEVVISRVKCPMAFIYGERSALFPPEVVKYMSKILKKETRVIVLSKLHHHLFLEKPRLFINTLRTLMRSWSHSPSG